MTGDLFGQRKMNLVPTSRLIWFAGAVTLPLAALVTDSPDMALLCLGIFMLATLLAALDALASLNRLAGVHIKMPEVVRMARGRESEIDITVIYPDSKLRQIRVGLAWPSHIFSQTRDQMIRLPGDASQASFPWSCKALRQGRYFLNACYLEVGSPLGFWSRRASHDVQTEIRAYPDLMSERHHLSALFMNRKLGIHAQRQLGKGRDFEQLREYMSGDNYEDIYWKATAKRGFPVTKIYQLERTQDVYVVIDASRLSIRHAVQAGPLPAGEDDRAVRMNETIFDRYITAALVMGLTAERQGDHFGILTFADQVQGFIRAKNGKAHYNACRDMLFTLQAKRVTPDFSEVLTFIGTRIRKRALLIFLTHLDDPVLSDTFVRHIHLASRRHVVLVNMMNPSGAKPLFSSGSISKMDDVYVSLAEHVIWEKLRETEKILRKHGAWFSSFENETMCAHLISQYIGIKQRQLL